MYVWWNYHTQQNIGNFSLRSQQIIAEAEETITQLFMQIHQAFILNWVNLGKYTTLGHWDYHSGSSIFRIIL